MIESILLSFFLITNHLIFTSVDNKTFTVKGFVQIYSGNQMDINELKPIVKKSYKVLVVKGVHAHKGKQEIEMNYLDSYYEIINTKKDGEFQIALKPGIYTFFILKGDEVYLNSFDGLGNFSHIEVKDDMENFIIKDVKNAIF